MTPTSLPLIGIVLLLGIGCCWRSWLQRRRSGSFGVIFLRSGDWRQKVRDAMGIVLVLCLLGQGIAAVGWPASLSPVVALYHPEAPIWRVIGAVVLFGGLMLVIVSQLDLGASWRIGIDESARPGLVTNGLYQVCRNPIFLAILVTLTGYTILIPTRLSLILLVGAFIGMRQQVKTEEAHLLRAYGDDYRAYARRVGRFVPGIGRLR